MPTERDHATDVEAYRAERTRAVSYQMFKVAFWGAAIPFAGVFTVLFLYQRDYRTGLSAAAITLGILPSAGYAYHRLARALDTRAILLTAASVYLFSLVTGTVVEGLQLEGFYGAICITLMASISVSRRALAGLMVILAMVMAAAALLPGIGLVTPFPLAPHVALGLHVLGSAVMPVVIVQLLRLSRRLQDEIMDHQQRLNHQLLEATVRVDEAAAELSEVSMSLASTTAQLGASASEQAVAVTETASTVAELAAASRTATETAEQITGAAARSREASAHGRAAAQGSREAMTRIAEDAATISTESSALLGSLQEIEAILEVVKGIAAQSTILAVNSSIEASAAGSAGAGFAVVAQEVRELAVRSKDAASEIARKLQGVRRAIEGVVATAHLGVEQTRNGVHHIDETAKTVSRLDDDIAAHAALASVIANTVREQAEGLLHVRTAMEQVRTAAQENRAAGEQLSDLTTTMNDAVERLQTLVAELRAQA